jgi:hypothetical protein
VIFEVFATVKNQAEVFEIVTPCNAVFRRQFGPLKGWYPTTTLSDITSQKTSK